MTIDLDSLPDDVESLKELVRAQRTLMAAREIEARRARLEIEKLRLELARLRRMKFGRSPEKLAQRIKQLELLPEELETSEARLPVPPAALVPRQPKPARKPLPDHLPREAVVHEPACECPQCGAAMRKIGEDVSEMLEYLPARFKVIRQVRPKLSCTRCDAIVQQPAPSCPIARGMAGPGLLAHVLVSKYAALQQCERIHARGKIFAGFSQKI